MANERAIFETIEGVFAPFASVRERGSIKMHSVESRFVTGPSNILFGDVRVFVCVLFF